MYYIAKTYNGYALFKGESRRRVINNAYHFSETEYKMNKAKYKMLGYKFYKVLEDGSRKEMT